jgi:hypothetical protein
VLTDADKQKYARQLLLAEVGVAGQLRLCATTLRTSADADAHAAQVASEYLTRAGVRLAADGGGDARVIEVASSERVRALAGDPALREAAAWLAGSFAAVEAIKVAVGAGAPATLPENLVLATENG